MNTRRWTPISFLIALIALTALVACNRARNDAQIAGDVQQKINADANVPTKQITVSSNNGVVTLSGNVGSDMERAAAANDAAQIEGVRTVVNNLQVGSQQAQAAPPAVEQSPEPAYMPAPAKPSPRRRATTSRGSGYHQPGVSPVQPAAPAIASAPAAQAAPAPPPRPVTVPDGTTISIRMIDPVDSDRNQIGDRFRATLDTPITLNDQVIIPAGADVEGRVAELKTSGHFTGQSQIALELTSVSVNGRRYSVTTNQFSRQGSSRGKNTAAKVGGGAAVGAILGGIIGGGKGAAIGATVGAGAGTGVQAATKGEQIHIKPEQLLSFRLEAPLTVTPSNGVTRAARNYSSDYSESNTNYNNMPSSNSTSDYSDNQTTESQSSDPNSPPVLKRRPQNQ